MRTAALSAVLITSPDLVALGAPSTFAEGCLGGVIGAIFSWLFPPKSSTVPVMSCVPIREDVDLEGF